MPPLPARPLFPASPAAADGRCRSCTSGHGMRAWLAGSETPPVKPRSPVRGRGLRRLSSAPIRPLLPPLTAGAGPHGREPPPSVAGVSRATSGCTAGTYECGMAPWSSWAPQSPPVSFPADRNPAELASSVFLLGWEEGPRGQIEENERG
jgi:hypothetical protein